MKKIYILFLFSVIQVWGQNPPSQTKLDSIYIEGYGSGQSIEAFPKSLFVITARELALQPVESLEDILKMIPGIDIRTRGSKGVQADISIRGGNFDQVLILLNGIPVNNPQTGHHSLDLPVDPSMIEKIEVLEGAAGQSFGVNAYSGAINIITKNPSINKAETSLKAGEYGYLKTDWNLSRTYNKLSVFNGLSYQRSDGYLTKDSINNTDFVSIKDFLNLVIETKKHPVNIQLGYHQKDFGANSFYTSKYPWQYEKTRGYFANISKKTGDKIQWNHYLTYRLHFDEFQLFRESLYQYQDGYYVYAQDTAQYAPGVYYRGPYYHKTQSFTGGTQTRLKGKYGESLLKLDLHTDKIWSNVLGEDLAEPIEKNDGRIYTKSASRFYADLNAGQTKKWKNFSVGGSINFLYHSDYKLFSSGGFYFQHTKKAWTQYFTFNTAVRLPTYTDLYYEGPSNTGNPALEPERAYSYESGIKYSKKNIFASIALFYRKGTNTIDWIKFHPEDKWQARNLTELNTYGTEFYLKKRFPGDKFLRHIQFSYAYIYMDKKENPGFISKYVLDYLKHKSAIEIVHKFIYGIDVSWQGIYKDRNGQYLDYTDGQYRLYDYEPYFLAHIKLSRNFKNTAFFLSIENLFDTEYRDLSYIKMPGRWFIFGLKYKLIK